MDKKEFIDRLTEVAEWVYPMISENGHALERLKVNTKTNNIKFTEQAQCGPRIIKFKTSTKCNLCKKADQTPHVAYKKSGVYKCWLAYCYSCKMHIDTSTGEMAKSAMSLRNK